MKRTGGRIRPVSAQGIYYVASGLWPIIHLRSFMAVSGRKHDTWLVQTFGAFIAAVGAVLIREANASSGQHAQRLAITTAVTLAAADTWFVSRGRISPIYLADALVELALAAATMRSLSARDVSPAPGPAAAAGER